MTCARKILLSLALVILGLGFSSDANAINIYEQLSDGSGIISKPANNSVLIGEFTTTNAVSLDASSFVLFDAKDTDGFNCTVFNVGIYADGTTGSPLVSTNSFDINSSFEELTKYFSSSYTLAATTNYDIRLNASCNPGTADVVSNSASTNFYGYVSNGAATSTAITSINSPVGGEISTSTVVVFDYDYFYNSAEIEYNYAGIELKDITIPTTVLTTESFIDASGFDEYRKAFTLISNHQYMWRPYLRSATSSEYVYGSFTIFNVVSNPSPYSLYTEPFATSTATSSEYQYLNLISLLQGKHPIAYIPQTYALLQQEATLSGTSTFPEMTFDFTDTRLGSTTLGLTEVDMFSTSTITHFFNTTQINLFKNLITAVIWVGVVTFLVNDIRRTLLTTKN